MVKVGPPFPSAVTTETRSHRTASLEPGDLGLTPCAKWARRVTRAARRLDRPSAAIPSVNLCASVSNLCETSIGLGALLVQRSRVGVMRGHALAAIAVLATSAALAEDRCTSLTETGMAAVANLELRQIRVEKLRASLPPQPSAHQKGELASAIANLSRAARSLSSLVSEAVRANCPVADPLVEAESTSEEVVAEVQAPDEVETTGSVAPH
jgi:hypothetical protein